MTSNYIKEDLTPVVKRKNSFLTKIIMLSVVFSTLLGLFGLGLVSTYNEVNHNEEKTVNADIVQFIMCSIFGPDSISSTIYNVTQGTDLEFAFFSKSYLGSSQDNVSFGLNAALDFVRTRVANLSSFEELNQNILGTTLDNSENVPDLEYNGGTGYGNPFDRFGVAGLKFTSYAGEWKSYAVDACNNITADRNANLFYTGRLEPNSTWDSISTSPDPRTKIFDVGLSGRFGRAFLNNLSNWIFEITKIIIVAVIVLIGFAFADIPSFMGITDLIAGNPKTGSTGIYNSLHQSIFVPLIVLIFILTAMWILYQGIVKRQYRMAFTGAIRSVAMFVIAIIIAINPAWFISLPNTIALTGQALVGAGLSGGSSAGAGVCDSTPESFNQDEFDASKNNDFDSSKDDPGDWLEALSAKMQSQTGCLFWDVFLVKPWLQGQWGVSNLEELNYSNFGNSDNNKKAIGFCPLVPLGDHHYLQVNGSKGSIEMDDFNATAPVDDNPGSPACADSNWAIFQISTQTNAHAPTETEAQGYRSKYSQGVAHEWWAVVDAVSNYSEIDFNASTDTEASANRANQDEWIGTDDGYHTGTTTSPDNAYGQNSYEDQDPDSKVTPYWDDWTGKKGFERIGVALLSVPVAVLGTIAPMFFAFLSAMYSLGVAIMMAFAPIMFLFAAWANKGFEIFKSWGQMVLNLTMKRIAVGLMLMFSIIIVSIIFNQIFNGTTEWFMGILELILISVVLIKSRDIIFRMFSFFKFASDGMSQVAGNIGNKFKSTSSTVGRVGTATAFGAAAAHHRGASVWSGAKSGFGTQMTNVSYRSPLLSSARVTKDKISGVSRAENRYCDFCGLILEPDDYVVYSQASALEGGTGYLHYDPCSLQSGFEDLEYIGKLGSSKKQTRPQGDKDNDVKALKILKTTRKKPKEVPDDLEEISERRKEDINFVFDKIKAVEDLIVSSNREIKRATIDQNYPAPTIPSEILPYVDANTFELAWESGNTEFMKLSIASGWQKYLRSGISNDEGAISVFEDHKDEISKAIIGAMEKNQYYDDLGEDYEDQMRRAFSQELTKESSDKKDEE